MSADYALPSRDQLLRHFPVDSPLVRDGVTGPYQDAIVKVRSDQYFASWAMTLENLAADPNIDVETFKFIAQKFSEELLYLQDAYKIVARH